jgi:hypothetical protein
VGNCEANRMSDSLMFIGNATVSGHLGSARGLTSPWTGQSVNSSFDNSAKCLLYSRKKKSAKITIIRFAVLVLSVCSYVEI